MAEHPFRRGDRVRDTYSERIGFITGKTSPFGDSLRWQVGFGDGEQEYIRESYLELISDDDDMFSLFEQCRFNGVLDLRRIIQQIRLNGTLTNLFYSMRNSSAKFMQHQFKPVMKFIESTSGRLLITDEVGLGKTIEAIYIWKELLTRENAKRLLVVCPAQLCQKWKDDLLRYFGLSSVIVGAKDLSERLKETLINYNSDSFVLISSIQGIRYKEKEDKTSVDHGSRSQLNDFFESFDAEYNQELFDLVVIDEAHYLRNSETASFNTGEKLRDISRYMILLSATPIQTSSKNLYNLLRLLSPEDFYNSSIFDEMLQENRLLVQLANTIRDSSLAKEEIRKLYNAVKDKLQENVTLNAKILDFIKKPDNSVDDRMTLFHCLKDSNFYSQYFTRTRKRDVFENRIIRSAQTIPFELSEEEYQVYQEVTDYLQELSVHSSQSKIFTLIARQRQMASCLPAALKHWKDNDVMQDVVYELGLDDNGDTVDYTADDLSVPETPEDQIERFTHDDSKYNTLLQAIKGLLSENAQEKIIIFSYYRYTIHYLFERLGKDGFNCEKMMGGMGDEKEDIIDRFRNTPSCNILISSEVGSEGIDLQFASIEINYDLPWNPMRLEQRIGRIDRIGQEKEKIRILNFICQNTIEDRVLERLYDRIDIFKHSIGDIEEILGDKIIQLSKELLTPNLSEEQKKKRAFQTIEAIASNKIFQEELEEKAGLSTEFSDTILQNIHDADKNKRYITAEELIRFTEDFFAMNYSGTRIETNDKNTRIITLSTEAKSDFRDFIMASHYHVANLGYRSDGVFCIFNGNRDDYKRWKIFELIDINHPFIKWMKHKNQDKLFSNYGCSAIKVKKDLVGGIAGGLYVYYIQRWSSDGYRNTNELKYFAIETDTKSFLDEGAAEGFLHNSLNYGADFSDIKYGLENFDAVCYSLNKSKEYAAAQFLVFETNFYAENDIVCERNVQYLKRTIEKKRESIKLQIDKARQNRQTDRIIRMHEGKLKKNEETYKIQLAKLETKKKGRCNFADIALGLIKVED